MILYSPDKLTVIASLKQNWVFDITEYVVRVGDLAPRVNPLQELPLYRKPLKKAASSPYHFENKTWESW